MGLYWYTFACKGFFTNDENIIKEVKGKLWYFRVTTGFIVYVYRTFAKFNNINPIIENHEIKQGFVSMKEVLEVLKLSETHFDMNDEEKEEMDELMNNKSVDQNSMKNWIVETMWSSLDDNDDSSCLEKMLPIK